MESLRRHYMRDNPSLFTRRLRAVYAKFTQYTHTTHTTTTHLPPMPPPPLPLLDAYSVTTLSPNIKLPYFTFLEGMRKKG